jgi:hypothetical protein
MALLQDTYQVRVDYTYSSLKKVAKSNRWDNVYYPGLPYRKYFGTHSNLVGSIKRILTLNEFRKVNTRYQHTIVYNPVAGYTVHDYNGNVRFGCGAVQVAKEDAVLFTGTKLKLRAAERKQERIREQLNAVNAEISSLVGNTRYQAIERALTNNGNYRSNALKVEKNLVSIHKNLSKTE